MRWSYGKSSEWIAKVAHTRYICGKFLTILTIMQENDGKYIFGVVKVGDKGQIVIPRDARKVYDIKPGDALLMLGDQKGIALLKTEIFQSAIDQVLEGMNPEKNDPDTEKKGAEPEKNDPDTEKKGAEPEKKEGRAEKQGE